MMPQINEFADWLQARRDAVIKHEQLALAALKKGDPDLYRQELRAKARELANLWDEADKHAAGSPSLQDALAALKNFSGSAQTSLELDSPFYMSALLYNDDHKPGEPDNLQALIDGLKRD